MPKKSCKLDKTNRTGLLRKLGSELEACQLPAAQFSASKKNDSCSYK